MPEWVWDIVGYIVAYSVVAAMFAAVAALAGLVYALLTGKSPLKTAKKFLVWFVTHFDM